MKHRTLTLSLLLLAASAVYVWPRLVTSAAGAAAAAEPQQRRRGRARVAPRRAPAKDFSDFKHSTAAHRKDCASCHQVPTENWAQVRDRESAFLDVTDYPEHESCLGCHRTQFFNGARPVICSVCHSVVSPRLGTRHPFQNPQALFARSPKALKQAANDKTKGGQGAAAGVEEFAINFPHDVHLDAMAAARPAGTKRPSTCAVCHQTYFLRPGQKEAEARPVEAKPAEAQAAAAGGAASLPDGILMTSPTGHDSCFSCHWKGSDEREGGERPYATECMGCHVPPAQLKTQPGAAAPAAPAPAGKDIGEVEARRVGFADPYALARLLRRGTVKYQHAHESHVKLDCALCHSKVTSDRAQADTMYQVPILSCGGSGCHITASGPKKQLNVEVEKRVADATSECTFCHVNLGRVGVNIPKSHLGPVGK